MRGLVGYLGAILDSTALSQFNITSRHRELFYVYPAFNFPAVLRPPNNHDIRYYYDMMKVVCDF